MAEQKATNITWHEGTVSRQERQTLLNQKGVTVWMTGLSASGKSTIAVILEQMLLAKGKHAYRLDGEQRDFSWSYDPAPAGAGRHILDTPHGAKRTGNKKGMDQKRATTNIGPEAGSFFAGGVCLRSIRKPV